MTTIEQLEELYSEVKKAFTQQKQDKQTIDKAKMDTGHPMISPNLAIEVPDESRLSRAAEEYTRALNQAISSEELGDTLSDSERERLRVNTADVYCKLAVRSLDLARKKSEKENYEQKAEEHLINAMLLSNDDTSITQQIAQLRHQYYLDKQAEVKKRADDLESPIELAKQRLQDILPLSAQASPIVSGEIDKANLRHGVEKSPALDKKLKGSRVDIIAPKTQLFRPLTYTTTPAIPDITNLVFQGGGVKGIAYLGATEALFSKIDSNRIKKVGGTSAGAINALLLGLNYSTAELANILKSLEFEKFLDGYSRKIVLALVGRKSQDHAIVEKTATLTEAIEKVDLLEDETVLADILGEDFKAQIPMTQSAVEKGLFGGIFGIDTMINKVFDYLKTRTLGLYPGEYFRQFAESLVQQKTGIAYATFRDLYETCQDQQFKNIYFIGTNITTQMSEIFSYETTPDAIVSDALRISMSIPVLFTPHQLYIKTAGQRILDESKENCWYVDGGLLDNYPLWLFDSENLINPHTLGLRLVSSVMKESYENDNQPPLINPSPKHLIQLIWQVCNTLYAKQESDSYHQRASHCNRTIYINNFGIKTAEFDLSEEKKLALIEEGRKAVNQYFENYAQRRVELDTQLLKKLGLGAQMQATDVGMIVTLLKEGANPNAVTDNQESCLDLALKTNNRYLIRKLLLKGARVCKPGAIAEINFILKEEREKQLANPLKISRLPTSFFAHARDESSPIEPHEEKQSEIKLRL